MLIETRLLGRKRRPLDGWTVPTPPGTWERGEGEGLTLRELISRVVREEVRAFERRAQARRLLRVLSESEITEAAARGKVDSGGRTLDQPVEAEAAVGAAENQPVVGAEEVE